MPISNYLSFRMRIPKQERNSCIAGLYTALFSRSGTRKTSSAAWDMFSSSATVRKYSNTLRFIGSSSCVHRPVAIIYCLSIIKFKSHKYVSVHIVTLNPKQSPIDHRQHFLFYKVYPIEDSWLECSGYTNRYLLFHVDIDYIATITDCSINIFIIIGHIP